MKTSTTVASMLAVCMAPFVFFFAYQAASAVIVLEQGGTFSADFANFIGASVYSILSVLCAAIALKGFDR